MPDFENSIAKNEVRKDIFRQVTELRIDHKFTYLGLPGRECTDISNWVDNIRRAHCCETDEERFQGMSMNLVRLLPGRAKPHQINIWNFLSNSDNYEEFIDLLNLDFCGGPVNTAAPHLEELDAINSFLREQRKKDNDQSFIMAWTLGVRNTNIDYYVEQNLSFAKGVFGNLKFKKLENWLRRENKMIKNYYLYIPCIIFQYAKSMKYKVNLIETYVYKKTMYFSLLKLTPSERIVTEKENNEFVKKIFESRLVIFNEKIDVEELLFIPKNILT
jgi:hypothetical protein